MKYSQSIKLFIILIVLLAFGTISTVEVKATSFVFGAAGDFGTNSAFTAVSRKIGELSKPGIANPMNFFIAEGDLSYSGDITTWANNVKANINTGAGLTTSDPFGQNYPFMLLGGNHDDNSSQIVDTAINVIPNHMPNTVLSPNCSGCNTNYGKEYYFDYPTTGTPIARFILISPGLTYTYGGSYSYSTGSSRYNWLVAAIDDAKARGMWVIVNAHYNCLSVGSYSCDFGSSLFSLLVSKHVDLFLHGHDHNYQRSYPLACVSVGSAPPTGCVVATGNNYPKGYLVVVDQGTGGAGTYAIDTGDSEMGYFGAYMGPNVSLPSGGANSWGLTKFTVTDTSITEQFISAVGSYSDGFTIGTLGPTPTPTPTPSASPTATRNGDADGNGVVNTADVTYTLQRWLQNLNTTADQFIDAKINSLDFAVVRIHIP